MKDTERHHYIGEHICALRESKGWTQQTLGKKLGKKTSTISAYETNAKLPSADCLIEMAEVFGVSIDTLGLWGNCRFSLGSHIESCTESPRCRNSTSIWL